MLCTVPCSESRAEGHRVTVSYAIVILSSYSAVFRSSHFPFLIFFMVASWWWWFSVCQALSNLFLHHSPPFSCLFITKIAKLSDIWLWSFAGWVMECRKHVCIIKYNSEWWSWPHVKSQGQPLSLCHITSCLTWTHCSILSGSNRKASPLSSLSNAFRKRK